MARAALFAATLVACLVACLAFATPAQAAVPELQQPTWAELNPQQKQILAPLSQEWDKLEGYRRKKWLGIAARYPAMTPEEQARIQHNIKHWVNLSPDERKKARERYKSLQKASPEQRQAIMQKWEQYKELPDDEKKRLAEKAVQHPTPKSAAGKFAPKPPAPAAILKPATSAPGATTPAGAAPSTATSAPASAVAAPPPVTTPNVAPSAVPAK